MSSPDFLIACCVHNHSADFPNNNDNTFPIGHLMNIVTMVMCIISLSSVVYLLLPRRETPTEVWSTQSTLLTGPNLNGIIKSIIASSALATIGLLIRAIVWAAGQYPDWMATVFDSQHVFCLFITIWTEYFFIASFMWNVLYAIEVLCVAKNADMNACLKYAFGWILPCGFCAASVTSIYYPGVKKCLFRETLNRSLGYLFFLFPILLFLVLSPVFFRIAAKEAKKALIWQYGRYTSNERRIIDAMQLKFILIILSFVTCWLPNIINAILRITNPDNFQSDALLASWIFMGFLNPVQVVLATLVFWGIPKRAICWSQIVNLDRYRLGDAASVNLTVSRTQSQHSIVETSETEPLISFRRKEVL